MSPQEKPEDNIPAGLGVPLTILGGGLMAVAMVILFYICSTVFQIMSDPGQVKLVQFLMEKVNDSDRAVYGTVDKKDFDIRLGEPLRYVMYFFTGAVVLSILSGIFSGLITSGAQLLKMGMAVSARGQKTVSSDIIGPPV